MPRPRSSRRATFRLEELERAMAYSDARFRAAVVAMVRARRRTPGGAPYCGDWLSLVLGMAGLDDVRPAGRYL